MARSKKRRGCRLVAPGREQEIHRLAKPIDGPVQVLPLAADLDIGFVDPLGATDLVLSPTKDLGQDGQHLQCPAVNRGVADEHAALGHHLFQVTQAQWVGREQAHAPA